MCVCVDSTAAMVWFGVGAIPAVLAGTLGPRVGGWSRTSHNANLPLGGAIKSGAVAIRACLSIGRSVRRQHKIRLIAGWWVGGP